MLRRGPTFKDQVYDHRQWELHAQARRHCPGPLTCARIIRSVFWPMLFATLAAVIIGVYHDFVEDQNGWWPNLSDYEGLSTVFDITSFALALLLVFRTNACYGRWWEARILWGSQLNTCRNLVRQVLTWPETAQYGLQRGICRWITALSICHKAFLRGDPDLQEQLMTVLQPTEVQWVLKRDHTPNACTMMLSSMCKSLDVPLFRSVEIDQNITRLIDIYGGCERILKTPVPLSYTRHTSQFLMVYLCLIPLGLWTSCHWATPAVCCLVAFFLLGIENIGVQIEQPFKVLPLDAMCTSVKKSVTEAFNQHENAQKLSLEAWSQTNKWPVVHEAPRRIDDELTKPAGQSLDLQRELPAHVQLAALDLQARDSSDSESGGDNHSIRKYGPKLSFAKRGRSLPVNNHMSTLNLLSAEQRQGNNGVEMGEVRLDIKA